MVGRAVLLRPESSPVDELALSVHAVMRSVLHRLHPVLEAEGISMGQFWTLHLVSSLGSARVSTVARHLSVSAPTACAKVDELERSGLLVRHRSESDRRVVELAMTPKGRRVEARVWGRLGVLMGAAARGMPGGDVATAVRVFQEVSRRLDEPVPRAEVAA
jgi:DNA-binding MarR family transcriptional regulator